MQCWSSLGDCHQNNDTAWNTLLALFWPLLSCGKACLYSTESQTLALLTKLVLWYPQAPNQTFWDYFSPRHSKTTNARDFKENSATLFAIIYSPKSMWMLAYYYIWCVNVTDKSNNTSSCIRENSLSFSSCNSQYCQFAALEFIFDSCTICN